jgi:ATP-dependent exoDNAse (exonuclease V) beta subunit
MPEAEADPAAEAKLLYVAMTRAMERLVVTGESVFVERVEEAVEAVGRMEAVG